jgi:hypothetical protein
MVNVPGIVFLRAQNLLLGEYAELVRDLFVCLP